MYRNYSEIQSTLEDELKAVGYLEEKARLSKKSMSKELRTRKMKAMDWAAVVGMSRMQLNFFLEEGAKEARHD